MIDRSVGRLRHVDVTCLVPLSESGRPAIKLPPAVSAVGVWAVRRALAEEDDLAGGPGFGAGAGAGHHGDGDGPRPPHGLATAGRCWGTALQV